MKFAQSSPFKGLDAPCVQADWRRVAMRYDRCPKVFLLAIAPAAIVIYWL